MKILEAVELLKAEPGNKDLANAVADCFDEYLDVLEDMEPQNEQEEDELNDQIDAVSEMADTMFAYKEAHKAYAKALKTDAEGDASQMLEIILDLEGYLKAYAAKYSDLDGFKVNI